MRGLQSTGLVSSMRPTRNLAVKVISTIIIWLDTTRTTCPVSRITLTTIQLFYLICLCQLRCGNSGCITEYWQCKAAKNGPAQQLTSYTSTCALSDSHRSIGPVSTHFAAVDASSPRIVLPFPEIKLFGDDHWQLCKYLDPEVVRLGKPRKSSNKITSDPCPERRAKHIAPRI